MTNPVKLLANIVGCQDLLHNAVHVKQICVMRGVAVFSLRLDLALYKKLVVIKVAVIGGYAEIITHIFSAQTFLSGHKRFIKLFAVASADYIGSRIAEEPLHSLSQITDRGSVSLLNK